MIIILANSYCASQSQLFKPASIINKALKKRLDKIEINI